MKKLNTNNTGRMPLWQADLDWIQQAYTGPIEAIVRELHPGQDYFALITGCNVVKTSQTISMSAGWFFWHEEILPVRALPETDITSFNDAVVHLERVAFSNPDGARNFIHADQSTELVEDVWQDDYIQPTVVERNDSFTTGVHILHGARTLFDEIKARITDSESGWIQSTSGEMAYKRIGRMVVLRGRPPRYSTIIVPDYNDPQISPGNYEPVDGGFPEPVRRVTHYGDTDIIHPGEAVLVPFIDNEHLRVYIHGTYLYCVVRDDTGLSLSPPDLTGMMYMAEDSYTNIPVDMNIIVCEQ